MKTRFLRKGCADLQQKKEALDNEINAAIAFIYDLEEQRWDKLKDYQAQETPALIQALVRLGERFADYSRIEKEHVWIAESVAKFSLLIRNNQENMDQLTDLVLKEIVRHLGANQGAIFVIEEDEQHQPFLEMKAAYAYERKKFLEKRILPGQGLVGQCFIEGERVYMTSVPSNYVHITSGLGEATPRCILLLPLRVNEQTVGVIELASFQKITPVQFSFLDKVIENIAASFAGVKEADRVRKLLQQSEHMRKALEEREEEIRQNFEELKSLQEDQMKKQNELEKANKEVEMQKQEVVRIQQRESELMESKLKTQQMLTDKVIDKLKRKIDELQMRLREEQYRNNTAMAV